MSQPLSTGEFKWVDIENLKGGARELKRTIDMMVRNSNRGYGYVLEVDVKYSRELHDRPSQRSTIHVRKDQGQ